MKEETPSTWKNWLEQRRQERNAEREREAALRITIRGQSAGVRFCILCGTVAARSRKMLCGACALKAAERLLRIRRQEGWRP